MNSPLFRKEASEALGTTSVGQIVLIQPLSHVLLAIGSCSILVAIVVLMIWGEYTQKTDVTGVLEPSTGIVKLYTPVSGKMTNALVREGQHVRKDEILLVFSSERGMADGAMAEQRNEDELLIRLQSLENEWRETVALQKSDVKTAGEALISLQKNKTNLQDQISVQKQRVSATEIILTKFEKLQEGKYFSEIQVQEKRDELLDQRQKLQLLESQLLANNSEISKAELQLRAAPARNAVAEAQFKRNVSTLQTELNQSRSNRTWSIIAPCNGTVSSMGVTLNQYATPTTPLLTIVPEHTKIQANLYVPSRALGFVSPGARVNVKLDAYPYQKFGMLTGTVSTISGTPASPSELSSATRLQATGLSDEPVYSIHVALESQFLQAYGRPQLLRPGLQVSAQIEIDTRHLYEWVLEPLYR